MWKIGVVGVSLAVLMVCARGAQPGPAPAAASQPDISFDYRKMIEENIRAIADGKPDAAMDALVKRSTPTGFTPPTIEDLKRRFATIFGSSGKFEGFEVIGYRRFSSKVWKFYAVAHFERSTILFGYPIHQFNGEWVLNGFSLSDRYEEFERLQPMQVLLPEKSR